MKTAVVAGAGGFIGGALTSALLDIGYKIYGVDISAGVKKLFVENSNFIPVCVDLSRDKLSDIITDKVDVVFYLSWGGNLGGSDLYDEALQIGNVNTAVKVCKDAALYCNHFIFCGSSYEFMKKRGCSNIPINVYGIAKKAAAEMCASISIRNGMKFNKAILTNTYGVGDTSHKAVNTIINIMNNGLPLKLIEGNEPNDWVYIDDTVNGLIKIYENGSAYKEYYIGHRNISTFKEKIIMMSEILCSGRKLEFGTLDEDTYIDYTLTDIDALYNDTKFECLTDFKDSIIKTSEWVKKVF